MNNQILVSVVIPCYNKAAFLPDALHSVLQQTYTCWEVIIVNDGSTDETVKVAESFVRKDNRIRYLEQENSGASAARNRGIEMAKGTFILPLDADDTIEPTYMEEALMAFEQKPELSLVYCQGRFFGIKEGLWEGLHYQDYAHLLLGNSIFCSAFFRKSDWAAVGGYDEAMRKGHEDWEFYIRLLQNEGAVCQLPKVLFNYRIQEQSLTTLAVREDVLVDTDLYIYKKNRSLYAKYFGNRIFDAFAELLEFRDRKERHRNKWYRKLFYKLKKAI